MLLASELMAPWVGTAKSQTEKKKTTVEQEWTVGDQASPYRQEQ